MEIKYGVTGKDRKALVMAIAEITGADAIYKGVPTCNYEVDYFTIDKSGTLIFDDSADSEEVEHLLEELANQGFVAEQAESEGKTIDNGFSVSLPIEKVNVFNLQNLLESKKTLIRKALGIDSLKDIRWKSSLSPCNIRLSSSLAKRNTPPRKHLLTYKSASKFIPATHSIG